MSSLSLRPTPLLAVDEPQEVERSRLAGSVARAPSRFERLCVKRLSLGPVAAHLKKIEDRRREVQDALPFTCGKSEPRHGREIGQLSLNPVDCRLECWRQLLASRRLGIPQTDELCHGQRRPVLHLAAVLSQHFERDLPYQRMHRVTTARQSPDRGRHQLFGAIVPILCSHDGRDDCAACTRGENAQSLQKFDRPCT